MIRKRKIYEGIERRVRPINDRRCDLNCLDHSGLVQKIESIEEKAQSLDRQGFLTTGAYWWTTGILVSIIVTILSAIFYFSFQATETLREVKTSQATLTYIINIIKADVEDLKKRAKP